MIFLDTQETVAPDECVECGGWLHHEEHGGFPAPGSSFRVCSQECIEEWHGRTVPENDWASHE